MLRALVLFLLVANGAYLAWAQGALLPLGLGPAQQTEPHRMAQQIHPEALRVVTGDEARRLEAAAAAARPPECLAAGPLSEPAIDALRQALQPWPAGSWMVEPAVEPARWIVYMGKYAAPEDVARKRGQLRQLGVSFEALSNPELEPGLSLGGFPTQQQAAQHLERLSEHGVRTARVVQERAESRGQRLVLPAVDDALRERIDALRTPLGGRQLRPCR